MWSCGAHQFYSLVWVWKIDTILSNLSGAILESPEPNFQAKLKTCLYSIQCIFHTKSKYDNENLLFLILKKMFKNFDSQVGCTSKLCEACKDCWCTLYSLCKKTPTQAHMAVHPKLHLVSICDLVYFHIQLGNWFN